MRADGCASSPKWFVMGGVMLCLVSAMTFWLTGPEAGPAGVPIEDLLLNEAVFPEGWTQHSSPSYTFAPVRVGIYRIGATYVSDGGVALHQVYEFRTAQAAADEYVRESDTSVSRWPQWSPWEEPADLPYQSSLAQQFHLACQTEVDSGREACEAVGQYERFVIRFHTFMSPELMTYAHLERILRAIDQKMALYLEKDTE